MNIAVSTLILAGGKSSRMGEDKALLKVNEKPLLSQIYDIAKQSTFLVYIVTPFSEKYRNILPNDCLFIKELNCFEGPLIAINQTLKYLHTEWILILACDLPCLTVTEIQTWLTYLPKLSVKVDAFLPINSSQGWECLCGFYRLQSLVNLPEFINQGNTSLQKWLKTKVVQPIPLSNPHLLFNCNTKEDYQKISTINY